MSEYYIVIDRDEKRRHQMCTLLSAQGYVIPLGSIEEIQGCWPDQAWIFAGCERDNLQAICAYLQKAERFYPIVPFGESPSGRLIMDLINSGCIGYVELPSDRETVSRTIAALRATATRMIAIRGKQADAARRLRRLTARETEVVKVICRGLSNKETARILGISPRTVEVHRANAMLKLGMTSTIDMVRMVIAAEDQERLADIDAHEDFKRAA